MQPKESLKKIDYFYQSTSSEVPENQKGGQWPLMSTKCSWTHHFSPQSHVLKRRPVWLLKQSLSLSTHQRYLRAKKFVFVFKKFSKESTCDCVKLGGTEGDGRSKKIIGHTLYKIKIEICNGFFAFRDIISHILTSFAFFARSFCPSLYRLSSHINLEWIWCFSDRLLKQRIPFLSISRKFNSLHVTLTRRIDVVLIFSKRNFYNYNFWNPIYCSMEAIRCSALIVKY